MKNTVFWLAIIACAYFGYKWQETSDQLRIATSNQTTDREREAYGAACVDWRNEETKERKIKLALGRSWKKHGQMVFEIIPAHEEDWKVVTEKVPQDELPAALCTFDRQSGTMYVAFGSNRERWMFYE